MQQFSAFLKIPGINSSSAQKDRFTPVFAGGRILPGLRPLFQIRRSGSPPKDILLLQAVSKSSDFPRTANRFQLSESSRGTRLLSAFLSSLVGTESGEIAFQKEDSRRAIRPPAVRRLSNFPFGNKLT